jgi:hypothetical protein
MMASLPCLAGFQCWSCSAEQRIILPTRMASSQLKTAQSPVSIALSRSMRTYLLLLLPSHQSTVWYYWGRLPIDRAHPSMNRENKRYYAKGSIVFLMLYTVIRLWLWFVVVGSLGSAEITWHPYLVLGMEVRVKSNRNPLNILGPVRTSGLGHSLGVR